MGRPPHDPSKYIGKRYGRLTIIGFDHTVYIDIKHRLHYYKCKCDCGNEIITSFKSLSDGSTLSCGCYNRDINRERAKYINYKHGLSKHRLFHIWSNMKARCYNPNNGSYIDYGARGIKVCDEWLAEFKTFYNWAILHGYSDDLSIDRIDYNGNYEPSNCRWVGDKLQQSNRRDNVYITYTHDYSSIGKGKLYDTFTLSDWARICKVDNSIFTYHLKHRNGRSVNEIIDYLLNRDISKSGRQRLGYIVPDNIIAFPDKYEQSIHD